MLTLCGIALLARAIYLQVIDQDFLARQGDARILRDVKLSANRGMVLDRNGEPLAVSTPVDTVWADPRKLAQHPQDFARLAKALDRDKNWLARRVTSNLDREFVYLVRHMRPSDADKVKALGIPGVDTLREYRRYYPAGEVTGHLLGFTNVDDVGQEGLELAFDQWLGGEPGIKRVMRDRDGRTIEDIERIKAPRPGQDLRTSIDLRVQYLAYRALKQAVQENAAHGGSVVVLDIQTGEVLAMVNQPAFNPNDREQYLPSRYRNRATNDFFEPGSSIKPFVVAAGMKTGRFHSDTLIETGPGTLRVGIKTVKDKHNLGTIDVRTVLEKSSNVGVVKIALTLKPQEMWTTLHDLGFGSVTGSGFPGESAGILHGLRALALDRPGHDVLWLRPDGHAAAARAGLCRARRGRHAPPGEPPPGGRAAGRRADHGRNERARDRADDGERRERGRHGPPRRRDGLSRVGQDRHLVEGGRRRLQLDEVHGRVRRRRAVEQSAPRGDRGRRRAERRQVLRRRRRRPRVFRSDVRRAPPARHSAR